MLRLFIIRSEIREIINHDSSIESADTEEIMAINLYLVAKGARLGFLFDDGLILNGDGEDESSDEVLEKESEIMSKLYNLIDEYNRDTSLNIRYDPDEKLFVNGNLIHPYADFLLNTFDIHNQLNIKLSFVSHFDMKHKHVVDYIAYTSHNEKIYITYDMHSTEEEAFMVHKKYLLFKEVLAEIGIEVVKHLR